METIKQVLMRRDGMTAEEAEALIEEAVEELRDSSMNMLDAEQICQDYFGLEPDYLMELINRL
jgi:isopropylmalate/homocitrate/citramalate synthase